ncbi:MAG: PQQ-binding-like beta-propeller repeat protein [Planctomycetaceae bacterium]
MPQRLKFWLITWSLILTFAIPFNSIKADDWPQWRGPHRNGMSDETGLSFDWKQNPPKLLWSLDGLGSGYASVAVVGDRIYTTSNGNVSQAVIAIDGKSQQRIWAGKMTDDVPKHGYDGSRCTPYIDGEYLYAIPSSGKIICMKTENGDIVWQKDFQSEWDGKMMSGWGFSESPLVDGDWVLCTPGGDNAMIVALDKMTGDEIWRSKAPTGANGKDGAGCLHRDQSRRWCETVCPDGWPRNMVSEPRMANCSGRMIQSLTALPISLTCWYMVTTFSAPPAATARGCLPHSC